MFRAWSLPGSMPPAQVHPPDGPAQKAFSAASFFGMYRRCPAGRASRVRPTSSMCEQPPYRSHLLWSPPSLEGRPLLFRSRRPCTAHDAVLPHLHSAPDRSPTGTYGHGPLNGNDRWCTLSSVRKHPITRYRHIHVLLPPASPDRSSFPFPDFRRSP